MKDSNDSQHEQQMSPLISDDDFVELMEAEFHNTGLPVDKIGKKQTWKKINEKISAEFVDTHSWLSISIAALVILSFIPLIIGQFDPITTRIKGTPSLVMNSLSVHLLDKHRVLSPLVRIVNEGDTLVFKVNIMQSSITALAMAKNNQKPSIRFISEVMAAGHNQILQKDGQSYAYVVEADDRSLDFCLISAATSDELRSLMPKIKQMWTSLPNQACSKISLREE